MPKIIQAVILLFSFFAYCQAPRVNCEELIETKTYPGGSVMSSPKEKIRVFKDADNGLEIMLVKTTESVIVNFNAFGGIKCVRKNAIAEITFTDDTKLSLQNMGDLDCRGNFSYFMGGAIGKEKELGLLKLKTMKKVKIEYADTDDKGNLKLIYEETAFTKEQGERIMKVIDCLTKL